MSVTVKFKDGSIVEYPDANMVTGSDMGIEIAKATTEYGVEVLAFVSKDDVAEISDPK